MQEVMQKRLAIVVMMVMTALKISLAVGFLLKNDIFTNFFFNFFYYNNNSFSPNRRGEGISLKERNGISLKGGSSIFFENSPVPSCPKEGLHRFPLNPLSPQGTGDLKPGRPGLYEQTSSRPKGLLVEFYATELRLSMR